MKVKHLLLMLCLATGLSLGGLYGCGGREKTSDSNNSTTTTSEETASNGNAGANDAEIQQIQQQLEAVKTAHQDLKTFIDSIEVTENGTKVNAAVDYTKAKQLVDNLVTAYNNFNRSLSDEIQPKINFDQISPHIDKTNKILEPESPERAILSNLAKGYPKDTNKNGTEPIEEYGQVQTALSQLKIGDNAIYSGTVDKKDGSGQRIAVKKLLLYKIYQPIEPLTKVTITVKYSGDINGTENKDENNPQSSNTDNSENNRNNSEENHSNISTSDNGGIFSLLNTIVLLGAVGTGAFVIYKVNKLDTNNKEDKAFLIKLKPEEDQQTNEQVQAKHELDTNLKRIQESLQEIKDSFIDDSVSLLSNKNNTPLIDLTEAKYTQLIGLINQLGYLLDDTYIAMLKYNNLSKYDRFIEGTIKTIKEHISEHIKGLENRNQDNNRIDQNEIKQAIDNSLSTVKPKLDSIFEKLQSFSSHNLQNAMQASDNTLTEQTIQEFKDKIQELKIERDKYEKKLEEERNQYEQERQVKDDKIAELETGETGKIRQEFEELLNKYQQLNNDYNKIYQYYERYQNIETEGEFNQVRQELQKKIDEKDEEMQQKDQKMNQLKGEVKRLQTIIVRKPTKNNRKDELNSELNEVKQELKEIIEQEEQEILGKREKIKGRKRDIPNDDTKNSDYSSQLQALVNLYMQNPEEIRNNAIDEVMEDDDNLMERKMNPSRTLIFNHSKSPGGYYIIAVGDDYFLFPKQHGIPVSQKSTAREVFDGYKTGNTSKFTLIIPAQVIRCNNGRWQLINKGRLEYS